MKYLPVCSKNENIIPNDIHCKSLIRLNGLEKEAKRHTETYKTDLNGK